MTVSFIIITMTEFYNRYRDLFKAGSHKYKNVSDRQQFLSTEPHYVPPTFSKPTNHINISRSPALEEFERQVLPRFGNKYPQQLYRLKTEMDENTHRMVDSLEKHSHPQKDLYRLPEIYGRKQSAIKQRVMTEGYEPQQKSRQQGRDMRSIKNINKNIQELQQQYFGKKYPKREDRVAQNNVQYKSLLKNSRQKSQHSRDKASALEKYVQRNSRVTQIHNFQPVKKWQIKVLPSIDSKKIEDSMLISSPRSKEFPKSEFRAYQNHQKELYGMRDNQFAFVNSKIDEIKKSQKYYPRGYINSYRDALYRRRKEKNNMEQRRAKLRVLLYEDEEKMGILH